MRKRSQIIEMLYDGRSYRDIEKEVRCNRATISYHAKRIGLSKGRIARYDWNAVQSYHDAGNGVRACIKQFGFSKASWHNAVKSGKLQVRDWRIPLDELLVVGRQRSRGHIKQRLLNMGLLQPNCYECGLAEWRGEPLSLQLDHINGDKHDWRLDNLRLLCPNCHSQTDTYGGKNKKKGDAG